MLLMLLRLRWIVNTVKPQQQAQLTSKRANTEASSASATLYWLLAIAAFPYCHAAAVLLSDDLHYTYNTSKLERFATAVALQLLLMLLLLLLEQPDTNLTVVIDVC
jgi:hypothetical protein